MYDTTEWHLNAAVAGTRSTSLVTVVAIIDARTYPIDVCVWQLVDDVCCFVIYKETIEVGDVWRFRGKCTDVVDVDVDVVVVVKLTQ